MTNPTPISTPPPPAPPGAYPYAPGENGPATDPTARVMAQAAALIREVNPHAPERSIAAMLEGH